MRTAIWEETLGRALEIVEDLQLSSIYLLDSYASTAFNIHIYTFHLRDDDSDSYILVGIVGGNPAGCANIREYPDYFTYVGHIEVLDTKF